MLASAFFYSLATVRLSRLAPSVPSLPLATAKSLALAGVSLIWLGASALTNVALTPSGSSHQCMSSSRCADQDTKKGTPSGRLSEPSDKSTGAIHLC